MLYSAMRSSIHGFSLIEAVIGSALLALVATGISTMTIMTSRVAHSNIYENTAFMVAQAYGEQMKSIQYSVLERALEDPVNYDIPTQSLMLGAETSSEQLKKADPIIFGVPVEKEIVLDVKEGEDGTWLERVMDMKLTANGVNLTDTLDCWQAIEITINFEWEEPSRRQSVMRTGSVRIVRTNITE